MLAIFASAAQTKGSGLFYNPAVLIIMVLVAIYIFLQFCTWAKKFQVSKQIKKWVFILTGVGIIVFNLLYSIGNQQVHTSGNWSGATVALLASLAWVIVFSFVLMAETKSE